MLNIDVDLNSFWQFARHWKNCDTSKLELSCEAGNLQMTMTSKLGHPDKLHFPPPPPPDHFIKNKSPSMVRRQERRKNEAQKKNEENEDVIPTETEIVSDTALQFKCDMCEYRNVSEKGLKQHSRTRDGRRLRI